MLFTNISWGKIFSGNNLVNCPLTQFAIKAKYQHSNIYKLTSSGYQITSTMKLHLSGTDVIYKMLRQMMTFYYRNVSHISSIYDNIYCNTSEHTDTWTCTNSIFSMHTIYYIVVPLHNPIIYFEYIINIFPASENFESWFLESIIFTR